MNEWEFTSAAAGWINEVIGRNPRLPFLTARCEQRSPHSLKRRDLTLLDRSQREVLTGKIKLPYGKDGGRRPARKDLRFTDADAAESPPEGENRIK